MYLKIGQNILALGILTRKYGFHISSVFKNVIVREDDI